jgi:hypothetical protein
LFSVGGGSNNTNNEQRTKNETMPIIPTHREPQNPLCAGITKQAGAREPLFNINVVRRAVAGDAIKQAKTCPTLVSTLAEQTAEAADTLDVAVQRVGKHLETLKPLKKETLDELRGLRMATTTEVAAMLKPLEDLRKFFLGAEHDKEIERLREFVDLCERLEKLKQSGFLDTVADTMLKLS